MRHRKSGKRLGRNTSHRTAMMRNMVTSFFDSERITTTDARAKELRKQAEKLITMARRGDLHSRRLVLQVMRDKKTVDKLFETIAPRYANRPGGYTRIIKIGHRSGDNAALSVIELVEESFTAKPKKKKAPVKAATKVAKAAPVAEAPAEQAAPAEEPAPEQEAAPVEEATPEEAAAPAEEASAAKQDQQEP
ncbi:MAG: 50S ribosomal protein L17 [Desulfuromonadales bacterium]